MTTARSPRLIDPHTVRPTPTEKLTAGDPVRIERWRAAPVFGTFVSACDCRLTVDAEAGPFVTEPAGPVTLPRRDIVTVKVAQHPSRRRQHDGRRHSSRPAQRTDA